jgi:glycerol uptake facilitator-like aquaporin
MLSREHTSAVTAEFVGTFVWALGVLTVSKSSLNLPFFISATAGLAVAGMMLLFGRISGAQLNPAITLGLLGIKRISALKTVTYIAAQLAGGFLAYYLFAYFSGQRWHNTGLFSSKLLIAETIGALLFSLGWAAVVYQKLESAKGAVVVGLSFTLALLVVSSAGAVTLNPAVALGLHSWVWGSSLLGPIVGAFIGFQAYKFLFAPEPIPTTLSVNNSSTVKVVSKQPQVAKRLH